MVHHYDIKHPRKHPHPLEVQVMNGGTKRYTISLSSDLDQDLTMAAVELGISKAEALRRALMLFRHAVKANKIELTSIDGEKSIMLIK